MPAVPEFDDVFSKVRKLEINRQLESEKPCNSQGQVRIARKIKVELKRKAKNSKGKRKPLVCTGVVKYFIRDKCQPVCENQFLEQTKSNLSCPPGDIFPLETDAPGEIGE